MGNTIDPIRELDSLTISARIAAAALEQLRLQLQSATLMLAVFDEPKLSRKGVFLGRKLMRWRTELRAFVRELYELQLRWQQAKRAVEAGEQVNESQAAE